ncbi:MAG: AAA domain-containing protein [Rhodospirillaceae bacterium]|nr:AAA domain-containing protein [Rhodospirillaceae bacterium]
MVGDSDWMPAPGKLANKLSSSAQSVNRRRVIHGWPTVVMVDHDRRPKLAPLFVVQIEQNRDSVNGWQLHATTEPEFNVAITASGIFDPSIAQEIGGLLRNGLPFGDAEAFAGLAGETAELLGLDILTPLDPRMLNPLVGRGQGVYNAAISVLAERSAFNLALLDELRRLQSRTDWANTAAAHLLPGGFAPRQDRPSPSGPLAAPLSCNRSQEETLQRLRREPLTIVTGPPGTGKTQLDVNAVTNAWLDGDKVLVTSTNNGAVDVAVERAERDICCGLLIRTGRRVEREQVPGRITAALGQAKKHAGNQAEARAELKRITDERARLMEHLTRLDNLDDELLSVAEELETTRSNLTATAGSLWPGIHSAAPQLESERIGRRADRLLRAWFFRRFRARRLRRQLGCIQDAPVEQIVTWAELDQRQSRLNHQLGIGRDEYRQVEAVVGNPATGIPDHDRKWADASRCAIIAETATRIRSAAGRLSTVSMAPAGGGAFRNALANALSDLRGWACTALSASPNFPLEAGLFDLVIVDEASQCSLAAVLPLAYRARRLAVVGDPCQLQPIVPVGDGLLQKIAEEAGFDGDDLRRRGIHHKSGSAYFAFEYAARESNPPVLLDEHYRCHPHIARWFNRTFYNDELTVLTKVSEKDRTILWRDVEGEAERPLTDKSWCNRAEAGQAVEQLGVLLKLGLSVGVVTPFAAQGQLIERLAERRFGRATLDEAGFVCGTAHRLQGDERDAVVISPVLASGMPRNSARWIEGERNLLNVAVSRTRRALIVLGHPSIGELGSPTLASLRAYLRDELGREANDAPPLAEFRIDSRSEQLLFDAMQHHNLRPYGKLNVEGYELDFALMEHGIRLNIEVDGDQHLDARGRQRRQDVTRDRVLFDLGWTVLRIPAWRCHEDIGSVIAEIAEARDRLASDA